MVGKSNSKKSDDKVNELKQILNKQVSVARNNVQTINVIIRKKLA